LDKPLLVQLDVEIHQYVQSMIVPHIPLHEMLRARLGRRNGHISKRDSSVPFQVYASG
jgi:hypothetical protein